MRRRIAGMTVAAALFAGLLSAVPAPAVECIGQGYRYCGEHWPASKLPVAVVGPFSGASGVTEAQARGAARMAALTWEAAWPGAPSTCAGTVVARLFCYRDSGANATGVTSISFASSAPCAAPGHWVAVACTQTDSSGRLVDVDIVLNSSKTWHIANGDTASCQASGIRCSAEGRATGEVKGLLGSAGNAIFPVEWYDVQAVITHELGHALGLRDVYGLSGGEHCGPPTYGFPGDLTGGLNYRQTMYGCHWPGTAGKRTLEEGDVAGLLRVAADSLR